MTALASAMLAVYGSVTRETKACYCSCPITSGLRHLKWVDITTRSLANIDEATLLQRADHAQNVVTPNLLHAQQVVDQLRRRLKEVVIDPTAMPALAGWTQGDWRAFWTDVIERYVSTAYFLDGWQFSSGCVHEFFVSRRAGLTTLSENGSPLVTSDGIILIGRAIKYIEEHAGNSVFLRTTFSALKELHLHEDIRE
jgi:hypothetical protein